MCKCLGRLLPAFGWVCLSQPNARQRPRRAIWVCLVTPEFLRPPRFEVTVLSIQALPVSELWLQGDLTPRSCNEGPELRGWRWKNNNNNQFSLSQCMKLQIRPGVKMDLSGIQAKPFEVCMGIGLFASQESTNTFLTIKNLDLTSESTGSEWMISRAG